MLRRRVPFIIRTHDPKPEDVKKVKRECFKVRLKTIPEVPQDVKSKFIPNKAQKILIAKARQCGNRHTLFSKRISPWKYYGATTGRWSNEYTYHHHQQYIARLTRIKEREENFMKFVTETEERPQTVKLELEERSDEVVLKAHNEATGESKVLLGFKDGKFFRFGYANMKGIVTTVGTKEIVENLRGKRI